MNRVAERVRCLAQQLAPLEPGVAEPDELVPATLQAAPLTARRHRPSLAASIGCGNSGIAAWIRATSAGRRGAANKFADLARRRRPAAVLGDSFRLREVYRPRGWGSELRATFRAADATWGSVMLLRERGRPDFTASDAAFLASISRHLAYGLRRALLAPHAVAEAGESAPGLVVLDTHDEPEQVTPAAARWLAELDADAGGPPAVLPAALLAIAARTRQLAARPEAATQPACAHVRARSGTWLALHGSLLGDRVAIVVQPASPTQLAPLIAAAYGLTPREREIAALLLRGLTNDDIARRLWLSPHTVQDHAKAVYEKTGARDRLDLVARVFYQHAQPQLAAGAQPGPSGWFAS